MARITVEDCLEKINSQYDLVLLAKERTTQLNAGESPLVEEDNDKNTVISLREIGEGKISIKNLEDSAINKLRKQQEETISSEEMEEVQDDSFDKIYKGQVSKSGTAVLPSKRVRRIPEKIDFASELNEEKEKEKADIEKKDETESSTTEDKS
tara:strand:- start:451 stop:909 length:459 start_codon:yes stop_codon:yes gene_type:complete